MRFKKGDLMFRPMIVAAALVLGFTAHADLTQVTPAASVITTSLTLAAPAVRDIPLTVGDSCDYQLSGGMFQGTMHSFVRESTADGIWVEQDFDLGMMGKQKIEALYDKQTGKVLKLLANGQEQAIPDASKMKVVETRQESLTVPAGTFQSMYLKIHDSDKNTDTETWITKTVGVGGMIKTIAPSPLGNLTLELTAFVKK